MNIQFFDILPYIVSLVTAVGGWFAGKRKRSNDFLQDMQASIDMLTEKNTELVKKVLNLNGEVIKLRKENAELRVELESLNEKLSNVKTITRKL
jgi:FtsZ-binding cell division protein ZapB